MSHRTWDKNTEIEVLCFSTRAKRPGRTLPSHLLLGPVLKLGYCLVCLESCLMSGVVLWGFSVISKENEEKPTGPKSLLAFAFLF